MKKSYYYPAIFLKEENGYSVSFPDLPGCYTEGENIDEAYRMSKEAIGLYVQDDKGDFVFPEASAPDDIEINEDEKIVLIEFNPIEFLKNSSNKAVKKTLTIPSWLNNLAEQNNVNFSNVLQNALKEYLNVNN